MSYRMAKSSSWEQFPGLQPQPSLTSAANWYSDFGILAINARDQELPKVIRITWTRPHGPTAFAAVRYSSKIRKLIVGIAAR